jgi:hypothetical protein
MEARFRREALKLDKESTVKKMQIRETAKKAQIVI